MSRGKTPPDVMTPRRALALGHLACKHVASTDPEAVSDWIRAAHMLRDLLQVERAAERATETQDRD